MKVLIEIFFLAINEWSKFSTSCVTALMKADYTLMNNVGLSISQWRPCPFATWAVALDGVLYESCYALSEGLYPCT